MRPTSSPLSEKTSGSKLHLESEIFQLDSCNSDLQNANGMINLINNLTAPEVRNLASQQSWLDIYLIRGFLVPIVLTDITCQTQPPH